MNSKKYSICSRCVMDSNEPDISFDEQGNCNYCNRYFAQAPGIVFEGQAGQERLQKIVSKIRAEEAGREYDCILGVSGGVDSTFAAYHAKRLGLRPLAVHFDNGWNTELAVSNIEGILKKLDIDLYTHVVDWEEFRDLQLSFLKASVANCEIPTDHGFLAMLYNVAAKKGIRYFVTGSNFVTEGILPAAYGYLSVDLRQIRAIHRRFGSVPLKTFPQLSLPKYFYYRFVKGVEKVPILNYLRFNKDEAKDLIQKELGWQDYGGKHYESIYTRFFQSYILPRKFGFDKRRAHLATLVCSGQMTREAALRELETDPYPAELMQQDREYVIKKLGLTEKEFEDIMQLPVKTYRDYPNNSQAFRVLQKLNGAKNKLRSSISGTTTEVAVNTSSDRSESLRKVA